MFAEYPQLKMNSLNKQKHKYLMHTWSDKALKSIVEKRALLEMMYICKFGQGILFILLFSGAQLDIWLEGG